MLSDDLYNLCEMVDLQILRDDSYTFHVEGDRGLHFAKLVQSLYYQARELERVAVPEALRRQESQEDGNIISINQWKATHRTKQPEKGNAK